MLVYLIVLNQKAKIESATALFVRYSKSGFQSVTPKLAGNIADVSVYTYQAFLVLLSLEIHTKMTHNFPSYIYVIAVDMININHINAYFTPYG